MSAWVSLAVSYARSAMATALPGGSAVPAGYAVRQFRARGASQAVAAAVMVLSGAASVVGLLLLYGGDALNWTTSSRPAVLTGAAMVAAIVAAGVALSRRPRTGSEAAAGRLRRTVHATLDLARSVPHGSSRVSPMSREELADLAVAP